MNPRERSLLILIGAAVGAIVAYNGVRYWFINPVTQADEKIEKLTTEIHRLEGVIQSRERLAKRWASLVGRTLSYDPSVSSNLLAQDIKSIAKRHVLTGASFAPMPGMKIGSKTGIDAVAYRVSAEGRFTEALACLLDLYKTPYLCQITKLAFAPIMQKGRARDEVKLELTVETPLPPAIEKKQIPEAGDTATMTTPPDSAMGPARSHPQSVQDFPLLADRNIFRPYLPPPPNLIVVDNQDWRPVRMQVAFMFDGKPSGAEMLDTIAGKTSKPFVGKGDVVELKGTYEDSKPFGPEQRDFNVKKDQTFVVAVHSPPPPPTVVDLTVDNQDKDAVDIEVTVTNKDGPPKTKPTMRIKAGTKQDIDVYECKSVQVAGTYASGKRAAPATYSPLAGKQTYVVPPEPAVAVVPGPKGVSDPAPDASFSVTGLVTYLDVQEMIAVAGAQRKIIRAGDQGVVDGGTLLAVHPLGGVVRMPSGNYYIYPLGRKFTERVKLEAAEDTELATAIDAWSKR